MRRWDAPPETLALRSKEALASQLSPQSSHQHIKSPQRCLIEEVPPNARPRHTTCAGAKPADDMGSGPTDDARDGVNALDTEFHGNVLGAGACVSARDLAAQAPQMHQGCGFAGSRASTPLVVMRSAAQLNSR